MARVLGTAVLMWTLVCACSANAAASQRVDMPLRGHTLTLTVYVPAGTPRGTVVMGSGDVGWVGLAVARAQELSADGYVVVGVNVREYLAAFTAKNAHLSPQDIQHDFAEMSRFLASHTLRPSPVILSGVSEGAGIVVVAAAAAENHAWVSGVVTMGLPQVSEIAWRWSDFTAWITKKDADEPSAHATDYLPGIAPLPLVLIQSTRDEYVPERDYQLMDRAAGQPHTLVLINAANHRVTDKLPELRTAYTEALAWIAAQRAGR
jgi:hypothetical protein